MLAAASPAWAGPCEERERLCAPDGANTSAATTAADPELAAAARQAAAARRNADAANAADAAASTTATTAGNASASTNATPATPIRIALLLPTRSATLTAAAEAVRSGFMAGAERDGAGFKVELVSTGDTPQDALEAYARAAAASDIVVGPLARPAVTALVAANGVTKPTVALNYPEGRGPLPRALLVAGLSVEDEARQIAEWAAREHPQGRALVLTGNAAWSQRAAAAFNARWEQLGHTGQNAAIPSTNGRVEQAGIDALRTRLEIDPPALVFAALDVAELRQVRRATGTAVPCYAGGAANPGRAAGAEFAELDGVRLLDLPWMVRPDEASVMVYPRALNSEQPLDMDRLYALGIDAFLLARQLALHPGASFKIDGVTGRLEAFEGSGRLHRREAAAIYRQGVFEAVEQGR
ncbi:penicillin-binding protein activator [Massilia sp. 9096]|uniref:penicillin-binding protein activator n=1 Tax=Massilia sp. 9096 TaxID=1500894 RepID=UPI0018CEFD63|nr:penicillin-binding protein activator [Massilia sp. 9096]